MNNTNAKSLIDSVLSGISNADSFKSFLVTASAFYNYSAQNQLLIYAQNPQALFVAGYDTWKNRYGRQVEQGQKGIKIFAPVFNYKDIPESVVEEARSAGRAMPKPKKVHQGFKLVSVFDLSQTKGEPFLHSVRDLLPDSADTHEVLSVAIDKICKFSVFVAQIEGDSYVDFMNKEILINESLSSRDLLLELTKAYAKTMLPSLSDQLSPEINNKAIDAEVSAICFIMANRYGIDTSNIEILFPDIWLDQPSLLIKSLQRIQHTSNNLILEIDSLVLDREHSKSKSYKNADDIALNSTDKSLSEAKSSLMDDSISAHVDKSEKLNKSHSGTKESRNEAPDIANSSGGNKIKDSLPER